MAASGTFGDILNFIIPIAVYALLVFIIYRIPIVTTGVDKLIDWYKNRKSEKSNSSSASSGGGYRTSIGYE
jgi:hypothetical protein